MTTTTCLPTAQDKYPVHPTQKCRSSSSAGGRGVAPLPSVSPTHLFTKHRLQAWHRLVRFENETCMPTRNCHRQHAWWRVRASSPMQNTTLYATHAEETGGLGSSPMPFQHAEAEPSVATWPQPIILQRCLWALHAHAYASSRTSRQAGPCVPQHVPEQRMERVSGGVRSTAPAQSPSCATAA
jgi:hypothetical protein